MVEMESLIPHRYDGVEHTRGSRFHAAPRHVDGLIALRRAMIVSVSTPIQPAVGEVVAQSTHTPITPAKNILSIAKTRKKKSAKAKRKAS